MEQEYRNIYRRARKAAGLTQERWAEILGISVDSVKAYETGRTIPPDEIALGMSEAAGQQIYCYWHLLNKSRAASAILPELIWVFLKPLQANFKFSLLYNLNLN